MDLFNWESMFSWYSESVCFKCSPGSLGKADAISTLLSVALFNFINDEIKNSGTSDSGSIEYSSEGLALGEYRVKLRVMDFNGYIFETNEIQIYVTPPKPKIEAEIQRGGKEVTNANVEWVKSTNLL